MIFVWFTMSFQKFNQNKYKRKGGKLLEETSQGGDISGIVSSRSPNRRFYYLGWKIGLVSKSMEVERTFSSDKVHVHLPNKSPCFTSHTSTVWKFGLVLFRPIYDYRPLHEKIREITGDLRLDQTLTTILVPVFDVRRLFPRILHSYKSRGEPRAEVGTGEKRPKLSDVRICAPAAPTLFPAHDFREFLGYQRAL